MSIFSKLFHGDLPYLWIYSFRSGQILEDLKKALPCCDIVLEHLGKDQEHYHVEFDPKDDPKFQADKLIYRNTGEWP